ncbi:MAG: hypothetical protein AAB802_00010, partial [Patescibacteria group bacterium]
MDRLAPHFSDFVDLGVVKFNDSALDEINRIREGSRPMRAVDIRQNILSHYESVQEQLPPGLFEKGKNGKLGIRFGCVVERPGRRDGNESLTWHIDGEPICLVNITPDIACTEILKGQIEPEVLANFSDDITDPHTIDLLNRGIDDGRYEIVRCTIPGQMTLLYGGRRYSANEKGYRLSLHRRSENSRSPENRLYAKGQL